MPSENYLRTPAIAGPPARPIRAEEKWAVSKWPPRGPLLSLSAVPVHLSLMRQFQFQFQSRLRITETGTVSQIHILTMETISQSQRATYVTPLALCHQYQRSAKPGARVPRSRKSVQLHGCNMSFCSNPRKAAEPVPDPAQGGRAGTTKTHGDAPGFIIKSRRWPG
jgi:hypothetical protein